MLAALALLVAAPDPGPALPPPRLPAGVERVFAGAADEVGRTAAAPFRKRHDLELRLVVLDAHAGGSDCALLSRAWPLADPLVAGAAAALTGRDVRERGEPAVRLDFVRVDPRGRVWVLDGVGPQAAAGPLPPPADGLPAVEVGPFVPLPSRPVRAGDSWEAADPDRPPVRWEVGDEVPWNGAAAVRVTAAQQSPGYDTPAAAVTGWRRVDQLTVPPADGFAVRVDRQFDRREGATVVGQVRLSYSQTFAGRLVGSKLLDARRDADAARRFAADLAPLLAQGPRADKRQVRQVLAGVERHLAARPPNGSLREAVEAVRRQAEAAGK